MKKIFNSFSKMKYIAYNPSPPHTLSIQQRQMRLPKQNQYSLKIKSIAINRAQLLQRQGRYPPSGKQYQQYLGLQAAGQVYQNGIKLFDGMALLSGGSYGQFINIDKTHVMKIPENMGFTTASSIPEAWLTAYQILTISQLSENDNVVIYAGASGVGTAAIQICKLFKANPFVVVSSQQKIQFCQKLGAKGVNYKEQNWESKLLELNHKKPFNIVLDCVCASHFEKTIKLLGIDGRWMLYGSLSGTKIDINLGLLLAKRIQLLTSTLKSRSTQYKSNLIKNFSKDILPYFSSGLLQPIIDKVYKFNWQNPDVNVFLQAHSYMQSNGNNGKIVISYEI